MRVIHAAMVLRLSSEGLSGKLMLAAELSSLKVTSVFHNIEEIMKKLILLILLLPTILSAQVEVKKKGRAQSTTYSITNSGDNKYIKQQSGALTFTAATIDSIRKAYRQTLKNISNIYLYGAVAGGSTDNSNVFLNASLALPDSGGTIEVPSGVIFKVDSLNETFFRDNLTVSGPEGSYGTIIFGSGQTVSGHGSDIWAANVTPAGVSTKLRNVTFRNLRFIDPSAGGGAKSHILMRQIDGLTFDNCIFQGDGLTGSTGSFNAIFYNY